jgi:hypothetical protein
MEPADRGARERARTTPPSPPDPGGLGPKPRGAATVAAGAGLQFAVSLLLFVLLGQWLDRRLGTAPVFLFGFVFVGGAASFYSMYRQLMAAQRREAAWNAARAAAGRPTDGGGGPGVAGAADAPGTEQP